MRIRALISFSLFALLSVACHASVILSGNFGAGTGQLEFTQDLSFTITTAGTPRRIIVDEYLVYDGAIQNPSSGTSITYAINGVNQISSIKFQVFDGGIVGNDSTQNDLHISFWGTIPPSLNIGDVFTIRSITVTGFSATPGFNPMTGPASNAFLATLDSARMSATLNLVPEPSAALLGGLGALLLLRRRR